MTCFDGHDLRVKQRHNDARVLHDALALDSALAQLLHANVLEVALPVGVQLLLPFGEQRRELEDLVITAIRMRVQLCKLTICHISITFLRLSPLILHGVVLSEILGKIHALLEPSIAAPRHGDLIKVLEERYEANEVRVLQQLVLHEVYGYFDILEIVPLEQSLLLLSQRLLLLAVLHLLVGSLRGTTVLGAAHQSTKLISLPELLLVGMLR